MQSIEQPLPGVHLLQPRVFTDHRGDFVKTYHEGLFIDIGIQFRPVEEFFSTSRKGVLRGMHFQLPPHDHAKLVYCMRGAALDVLLDLRQGSPTYGCAVSAILSGENHRQFYIPAGIAHGFLSITDDTVMVYKTTTVHAPSHDAGVCWDSFEFDWGVTRPLISPRDAAFPPLADFFSPFVFP